jgi:hypothetical protein
MSQSDAILAHLQAGNSLTPIEALQRFGCFRLAARVNDLRAAGHNVITHHLDLPNGKRVASYRLAAVR